MFYESGHSDLCYLKVLMTLRNASNRRPTYDTALTGFKLLKRDLRTFITSLQRVLIDVDISSWLKVAMKERCFTQARVSNE